MTQHITWFKSDYSDRLVLRLEPTKELGRTMYAEYHTVIRGVVYGVTANTNHFQKYFTTYRVGPDGAARECNSGMGDLPLHYEVMTDGGVTLRACNDHGEVPRRTPCSMCKARDAAKQPCFVGP